ncbi:PD-(D/E)XK nuclease family protein (plasmid) [Methylocystis sp. MJC1]|uniref:PD-(D/E)XK nuclease family protein n=1 Tax=Methylocystis sp. MJC1 TaxID=2654282 RepID=UPI0013EBBD29|nr:PD-(D/E)XK nuclease family protein [Methylocystis sp. MJC1]KAF2991386.1 hypothetical protein MJC1_01374 [Methylocystis sp. MJC1]MBU6529497.1 PD-(D/E)XK nuclease family protein [Methylocystis sp. MJC1]UZX14270.1 PD-(D/E)XK nuclease family protein [Methylocystis sp. MJC1]
MDLVFSWFSDAGAWPEHPGSGCAVVDEAVVGPSALLDHVETMLGLGGPEIAAIERIAVYRRKIEAAGAGRFWSSSYELDSWSSTRELLSWRDELVEAGWRPHVGLSRTRLADLAAAENAGPSLPFGRTDRLRAVIDALSERPSLPLQSIKLVDVRDLFPVGWRTLLDALERCEVHIEELPDRTPTPLGDGRLTLLSADTELVAADALAAWLAADPGNNEGLVFVLGKDTALLDHALAKAGLPRLGLSAQSPHRVLLQVLPLSFALAWEPPDPNRLLDFLLLPIGPLPRSMANRLANVVAESPGIGGEDWIAAWAEIEKALAEEEDADPKITAKRLVDWRGFVEPERHDPLKGMPRAIAKEIAGRVSAWAVKRATVADDPLFRSLARIAGELVVAIDATDAESLDRLLIERMVEQAVGVGVSDPTAVAEAAPWRAVSHPGAVWGMAKTIVWWHFADIGEAAATTVWNVLERTALSEAGCPLDEPGLELKRLAAAWERPSRQARDRLLMIRPAMAGGAETTAHPLWHSLVAKHPKLAEDISVRAEVVLHDAAPAFAGRTLARAPVALVAPPEARAEWMATAANIHPREFESASSLEALLSCPLQWTLKYACRLRPGVRQSLPNMDNLVGTLAHRIAQEIFQPGAPPEPEHVETIAARCLDELLPRIAATLLLPGAAGELAAAKRSIPQALAVLARFLCSENLTIVGVEYEFSTPDTLAPGTGAAGRIDLLTKNPKGRLVVLDLKWQRSESRRRTELKNGVALQVAVYARHVAGEKADVATGFFMLRQRRFLTSAPLSGGMATLIEGPTPKETWHRISASFGSAFDEIGKGKVRATFERNGQKQEEFSDPYLLVPPKCGYCDYADICGVNS